MYIREIFDFEYDDVIDLIYNSVHTVCKNDYTASELNAWAPEKFNKKKFLEAMQDCFNFVAVEKGEVVGFVSAEKDGYINRLYTHRDFLNMGIASRLLLKVEHYLYDRGVYNLSLDSSVTAIGFYSKKGFSPSGVSVMKKDGVVFRNTVMKKDISGGVFDDKYE